MKPLLDADVLRYEIGFCGDEKDEEGNIVARDFDFVAELLDNKIKIICMEVEATEPPVLFLSADKFLIKELNRRKSFLGEPTIELRPNFREAMAVTKEYKGTRKANKPFHFYNLSAYMLANYDCNVANGIEGDDAMCIAQYDNIKNGKFDRPIVETVICSRDKDLRICPGWHYSWECGQQASIGPTNTDNLGWLEKRPNGKVLGYGMSFFYYQMLVGDTVDNIQGVPGYGPVKAFKALTGEEPLSEEEMYLEVVKAYQKAFPDDWKAHIREMANLLYMIRELDEEGKPVLYQPLKVKI